MPARPILVYNHSEEPESQSQTHPAEQKQSHVANSSPSVVTSAKKLSKKSRISSPPSYPTLHSQFPESQSQMQELSHVKQSQLTVSSLIWVSSIRTFSKNSDISSSPLSLDSHDDSFVKQPCRNISRDIVVLIEVIRYIGTTEIVAFHKEIVQLLLYDNISPST